MEHRVKWLKGEESEVSDEGGPVLYWMFREKRSENNWALLKAQHLALAKGASLAVVFFVKPNYMCWGLRHYKFALKGLKEVEAKLRAKNIPFHVKLSCNVPSDLMKFAKESKARAIVTDFLPLRDKLQWDDQLAIEATVPVARVDAHNIVPLWVTSPKLEYAARTIRKKIMSRLDDFLVPFPELASMPDQDKSLFPETEMDVNAILQTLETTYKLDTSVQPVDDFFPAGPKAANAMLSSFLSKTRLGRYDTHRNDPTFANAVSHLSPYFNSGQLSVQDTILKAKEFARENKLSSTSIGSFVEEAVVRRELSDNFCFYNQNYDNLDGAYDWARDTLQTHAKDKREYVYTYEEFANAKTHDDLWNAAQIQLRVEGKMHGFMRMYWAKKVLEWTSSPEEALEVGQKLNDTFALDGNDPNGFVGVGWSIMGIHDQGWREREVFGKIRYMNFAGCKRKFKVDAFIDKYKGQAKSLVAKKRPATTTSEASNGKDKAKKPKT